jgi:hypothetical protein
MTNEKKYDASFTKDTFCIHPTIIPLLTAIELNDTPSKRSNMDKEMVDKEDKVERLLRLTAEALPVARGKGLKWQGDNNMGNNDNSPCYPESVLSEGIKDDIRLQPFVAPVNHNTLTSAKAMKIVHTLMGNFSHQDKDKISQIEDLGNNACLLIRYYNKAHFE